MRVPLLLLGSAILLRSQTLTADLDRVLRESLPGVDGGASLLVFHEGKPVYRNALGKFQLATEVPIASSSKWLSAAVILALIDEGKLSLDDPASKFVPKATPGITLRQLFAHTSGIAGQHPCLNRRDTTLGGCALEIANAPPKSEPGVAFRYGGASMQLAGRMAEIASSKDWNSLFREKIAAPLGLEKTRFADQNPRVAGGAVSTLDEFGAFVLMIRNNGMHQGRQVLSPKAVALQRQDQTRGARIEETPYRSFGPLHPVMPAMRYGVGVWLERQNAATGEGIEISSQGAFGFSPWLDRERDIAGVLLLQTRLSKAMPLYLKLKETIRARVPAR